MTSPLFTLSLFGTFELRYQRQVIDLARRTRMQSLLAFLALHRNRSQTRAEITHALWPDVAESRGRNRLRNLIHQLRQNLPSWKDLVHINSTALQLQSNESVDLDVSQFEGRLALAAEVCNPEQKETWLGEAVKLHDGPLFPACLDDWIEAPRRRLRRQALAALEQLISLTEARRAWDETLEYADQLLVYDPLHEATYGRVMQLYARLGDTPGVVRTYERCRDLLALELDVEPDESIQSLYRHLVKQESKSTAAGDGPRLAATPVPLIGRDEEWNLLLQLWQEVQRGDSRFVVIQGEAGIGKTRLSEDFLKWVGEKNRYVASASCYAVEGTLAFAPVAEWLRTEPFWRSLSMLEDEWLVAIACLLPELWGRFPHLSESSLPADHLQRQHFFTALAVTLLEHGKPVLLYLDDLQWSDEETLDWLHYLLRYETPTPLLVVATLRTDDTEERERCRPLLRELQRHDRLTEMSLNSLSVNETSALAQHIVGGELYPVYAAQLYHETDGNPFFIVETVRAHPRSFIEPFVREWREVDNGKDSHDLPPKIRALIEGRLARLSPMATEIMQLAAVIGRRFDYGILAAAIQCREEKLILGMEELWSQNIVREATHNNFDFVHDKLRAVVYSQISHIRRRLLHRRVAVALEANQNDHGDYGCLPIAQHFLRAGALTQAAEYFQRAVHDASRRYAIESLLSASSAALDLLQKLDPDRQERQGLHKQASLIHERLWSWEMVGDMDAYLRDLEMLKKIGAALGDDELLYRESRYRAAALVRLGSYEEAKTIAQTSADNYRSVGMLEEEGICLTIMGRAYRELGQYADAVDLFQQALDVLERAGAHVYRIQALSYLSTTYWKMSNYEAALQCGQDALTICEEEKMPERKRFAWGDMGAAAAMLGQTASAREWLQESLRIADVVLDSPQEVFCRGHLGWLALREGKLEEARKQLEHAYELCQSADTINYASWLLRGLAELASTTGNPAHARSLAAEAISVAEANQQKSERHSAQRLLNHIQ